MCSTISKRLSENALSPTRSRARGKGRRAPLRGLVSSCRKGSKPNARALAVDRRQSLKLMAGGAIAVSAAAARHGLALGGPLATGEPQQVPVIDTHLHCFAGAGSRRFPYHERAPYRPGEAATPEYLLECMDGAGVDYAIVVHPEPYQDDHRYLEHCLSVGEGRLKGTCLFFSDRPESLERMPEFLSEHAGKIIAARLHAYAPGRLPPLGSPELKRWWRVVSDSGVAAQLHFEPRYAAQLEPYIREFSETTVIIDHLGRPMQGTPEEHARVLSWAKLPNTVIKLSSIPDQNRYPHRDVGPIIRQITKAFGLERIMYGGGFNAQATADSYRQYRQDIAEHLTHLSAAERAAIFGGNAARLFGWTG